MQVFSIASGSFSDSGKGLMFGPRSTGERRRLRRGCGQLDHIVVDQKRLRHRDARTRAAGRRVGEDAADGADGGHLGTDEINARVLGAAAAGEVAVEGAQRHARRVGRLPHPDAGPAGAFEHARARGDDVGQRAVGGEHLEHLLRPRRDGEPTRSARRFFP